MNYFAYFNENLGNYGLQHVMGQTKVKGHDATVHTKNRTKIHIDNLVPTMLKRGIIRLVALARPKRMKKLHIIGSWNVLMSNSITS